MATQVQYRRGTTAQNNGFTGALGEITVDTTAGTLRVHDGINAGGSNIATVAYVDGAISSLSADSISNGTSIVKVVSSGGNVVANVGGATIATVSSAGVAVTGNISATNTITAKDINSTGADLAEKYLADADYPVGTVLVFGGKKEVTESQRSHDPAIAGTVSDRPGHIMNSLLEGKNTVTVALLGRVPCRVVGNISKGDLLVSSDVPGVAVRLDQTKYQPGVIIGKALQDHVGDLEGVIEVVVGRT